MTFSTLLILACDAPKPATEPTDDAIEEGTPAVTDNRPAALATPSDGSNPEGYEIDEDDFPPKLRSATQDEDLGKKKKKKKKKKGDGGDGGDGGGEGTSNTEPDSGSSTEPDPGSSTGPDPGSSGSSTEPDPGSTTEPDPGSTTGPEPGPSPKPDPGTQKGEVLVALAGDMGSGSKPRSVYKLVLAEKADFLIIPGDFDYKSSPSTFESDMIAVLGTDYPVFATIGNHDTGKWKEYQTGFLKRLAKVPDAVCTGELGVDASCTYLGVHFVLSGIATTGSKGPHEDYIAKALASDSSPWSLCVWHKNQTALQAGDKPSDVGWTAFQHCQKDGAIVVMGHEHSYARTRTLTDVGNGDHGATGMPDLVEVGPGRTFSVVTGLGGKSIRAWSANLHKNDTWWGTVYTSDYWRKNGLEMKKSSADQGALFIRFNVGGDPSAAEGYFKTVDGDIIDEFDIVHK